MSKLREPTYKRFITGPISRFDGRNIVISKLQKEGGAEAEKAEKKPGS